MWELVWWVCGHRGAIQVHGNIEARRKVVNEEAKQECFVCWLIETWRRVRDSRFHQEDKYELAALIGERRGIRVYLKGHPCATGW